MGFSRAIAPATAPSGDALTSDMVAIGMSFAAPRAASDPPIEDTLLRASEEGLLRDDLRVLSVLTTWFGIHAPWVNADRLTRIASAHPSVRVRAYWAALARTAAPDRRFARLAALHRGARVSLLTSGTEYQLARRGQDQRFARGPLRVPAGILRDRPSDVVPPADLARRHAAYRWRVIIGPTYRADMWAALERTPTLTAAALARATYGSFATAWRVKRDFLLVPPARG